MSCVYQKVSIVEKLFVGILKLRNPIYSGPHNYKEIQMGQWFSLEIHVENYFIVQIAFKRNGLFFLESKLSASIFLKNNNLGRIWP